MSAAKFIAAYRRRAEELRTRAVMQIRPELFKIADSYEKSARMLEETFAHGDMDSSDAEGHDA